MPRRARRAFTVAVASVVVAGALAGAAVGLADEKQEPARAPASAKEGWTSYAPLGHHQCHRGMRHQQSSDSSALRY